MDLAYSLKHFFVVMALRKRLGVSGPMLEGVYGINHGFIFSASSFLPSLNNNWPEIAA